MNTTIDARDYSTELKVGELGVPQEIRNVPSHEVNEIVSDLKLEEPTWIVRVINQGATSTIIATPPPPVIYDTHSSHIISDRSEKIHEFLDFIAECESKGNYNAFFGSINNVSNPRFTTMTIKEVLTWQQGRSFSACGKYQIIRKTLLSLVNEMKLTLAENFDENMQDKMAERLLRRRGLDKFLSGNMNEHIFAKKVACEWASMPDPMTGKSVYYKDGVNHSHVSTTNYMQTIRTLLT